MNMSQSSFNQSDQNPFAAPEVKSFPWDGDERPAARIRHEHIGHEASLQSVGSLYILAALFWTTIGGVNFAVTLDSPPAPGSDIFLGMFFVVVLCGIFLGFIGFGLQKLKRWTRVPVGIVSGLGLLAIPVGTLINGYILYLVFSSKGQMVFSDEYREVIRQTPDIKHKTSAMVWILLLLLACGLVLGVVLLALFG